MEVRALRAVGLSVALAMGCDKVKAFAQPAEGAPPSGLTCPPPPSAPPAAPTPENAVGVFTSSPKSVKDVLSKRVHGEKPTQDDVRLLLAVCANLHDDACVAECQLLLAPPARSDAGAPPSPSDAATPYDQAKKIAGKDPAGARKILLPRVQDGSATDDERALLEQVCKKLKDKDCLKTLQART